nr:AAA family ATPase [Desulfovibrio gilichinskyi]
MEVELGSEDKKSGLAGQFIVTKNTFECAKKAYDNKSKELKGKLRDKAVKDGTGIKHNKIYGSANYNTPKLETDIAAVNKDSYIPLSDDEANKYHDLLKEEPKDEIKESAAFKLKYSDIALKAKELVEKKIQASDQVQEWLEDIDLAKWIDSGRKYHEGERDQCAFCGSVHPAEHWEGLWGKLDKHFNQESKELDNEIDEVLLAIENEKRRAPNLLKIRNTFFYTSFADGLNRLLEQFATCSATYCATFDSMKLQLEKRKKDIFTPLIFDNTISIEQDLNAIRDSYEEMRKESDLITSELGKKQSEARIALRLHDVFKFVTDIKYADECITLEELKKAKDKAETNKSIGQTEMNVKRGKINELKAQLKDESKGADRVNYYLNSFFGHQSLSLKAIEDTSEDASSGYRFEITRNNKKAFHLSEGECSLIAFCYFMAKLEDIETKGNHPIIWVDDPISSLDANHIFFVYILINSEIVKSKNYKQLFISTHSLDFLKYLKRISQDYQGKKPNRIKIREFFLIERWGNSSILSPMPGYLKRYVTEFNYLFHKIYNCAVVESVSDSNFQDFYNFGNNARKFLEIYLYYKYPNGVEGDDKLLKFFGDDRLPTLFMDRVNNEYSHLCGVFERGASPVDVPEMITVARQIITKIQEDPDQYSALLQSIGVKDDLF